MTTAAEVKLCECGCGGPTKPYVKTRNPQGHVKGEYAKFIQGHSRPGAGPKGPYRPHPAVEGMAPCRKEGLRGPACRALDCRRRMHRGKQLRRCVKGHPRHAGRGICANCRQRIRYGTPVELGPIEQPRMHPNEVLDEWQWLRGTVRWRDFHEKVGLSRSGWDKIFRDAVECGDPRAVKHPDDEPMRHWRAHDTDKEKAS